MIWKVWNLYWNVVHVVVICTHLLFLGGILRRHGEWLPGKYKYNGICNYMPQNYGLKVKRSQTNPKLAHSD